MAVFTQINEQDLRLTLNRFALGSFVSLTEISEGIENTNYFLETQLPDQPVKRWVLTVFENVSDKELPYFISLTQHLYASGLSVPAPLRDSALQSIIELKGKSAIIVPCFAGQSKNIASSSDCAQAGAWIANMHKVLAGFQGKRNLVRDLDWMNQRYEELAQNIPPEDERLLLESIARYQEYRAALLRCPQGTVHGDLFIDNVLFDGNEISGVIDFYHACDATLLFDLAVAVNDWASMPDGSYDAEKLASMVGAYKSERAWTPEEDSAWPYCLEVAALRFWVSRLISKYTHGYQRQSVVGQVIKDPGEMKRILQYAQTLS